MEFRVLQTEVQVQFWSSSCFPTQILHQCFLTVKITTPLHFNYPLSQHLVGLEVKKLNAVLRVDVAECKYISNIEMNS